MLNSLLSNGVTIQTFLLCTLASALLGAAVAGFHMFRNVYNKSFIVTLALLPAIVQTVIMMVNGNLGIGVAVAGAFSLVRFRSFPGSAKDITSIFLAMAVGLATGTGYVLIAALLTLCVGMLMLLYAATPFGEMRRPVKQLRITIPESLDYSGLFDDLFKEYTTSAQLVSVRTTNMGSLFQLTYHVVLRSNASEKTLLDEIRCRNGNLDILCGHMSTAATEL